MFRNAIVRIPASNFAEGLTTVDLGVPCYDQVMEQHARYCEALRDCGLVLTTLDADLRYPDSTFVEDTAVITPRGAILTRPGAASREGEVAAIRDAIRTFFPAPMEITPPGTVDGGDICEAGDHFFIGLSRRTNEEGARQLALHLAAQGYTSSTIDIRKMTSILHLKSGIAYIGDDTLVLMEELAENPLFSKYAIICLPPDQTYAANCVRVNDMVLVAAGYPYLTAELAKRGFHPVPLAMSEFRKMDGGLSCLSLRF